MGEYIKNIKLGTCEHLMYITRKEVEWMKKHDIKNSSEWEKYLNLKSKFIYRNSYMSEEEEQEYFSNMTIKKLENIINNRSPFDYEELWVIDSDKIEFIHSNVSQIKIKSANGFNETYNINLCLNDPKQKNDTFTEINYHTSSRYKMNIVGTRYSEENVNGYTILQCPFCGEWSVLSQEEIDILENDFEHLKNFQLKAKNEGGTI